MKFLTQIGVSKMIWKAGKYVLLISISLILIAFLGFQWLMYWSPSAQEAWTHVEHSKKLKLGMSKKEVIAIMEAPDKRNARPIEKDTLLYYSPPFAASSGIRLKIQKDTLRSIVGFE